MKIRVGAKNRNNTAPQNKENALNNNICFSKYLNETITAINGGDCNG